MKFSLDLVGARLPDLLAAAWRERLPLEASIAPGDRTTIPTAEAAWQPLAVGTRWGTPGENALIRFRFRMPPAWADDRVYLRFVPSEHGGAEGLCYLDGRPFHAIDIFHHEMLLNGHVNPGEEHEVLFEGHIWILSRQAHIVQALELIRVDADAEALYHDLRVLYDAAGTMHPESIDRVRLVRALEGAYRALDLRRPQSEAYLTSTAGARRIAATAYQCEQPAHVPTTVAVGHAHLDLAWMWRVEQTRRKGARTFSTALRLMERYPEYHFVVSQPALYEFIREDEPRLYDEVQARIREGRWEPTGATWVEMDCNITGGESLVRQFLIGKRYFRETLGVDPKVLWLPDVFGYSAALPQVMKGCGVDYFMTTKISWNEYNRIPYDTFRWRGIDGTEVLTHMVTVPDNPGLAAAGKLSSYTYNAKFTPTDIAGNWAQYQQKTVNDELLYLYGYGDGGGGPTAEMEEAGRRLADLPGFPRVVQRSAERFFQELDARVGADPDLPLWVGELYLEYHRGTYTSQAWIKRANRQAESLLHGAELWASAGQALLGVASGPEERAALTEAWKTLLFNQFHDVLPGSSIKEVYEDARRDFAGITERGEAVRAAAIARLAAAIGGDGPLVVAFNAAPFPAEGPVEVALPPGTTAPDGAQVVAGALEDERRILVDLPIPRLGFAARSLAAAAARHDGEGLCISREVLENQFFRLELDEDATIRSLVDKRTGREVIAAGERGNVFIAFEDRPLRWDAWDIQIDYGDKPYPVTGVRSWEVVEDGPLRGSVRIVRQFGESEIAQEIRLYRDLPRIDFPTWIDWHERQTLLKVAFPVSVNSARATFDIQWGNVERPTHWNTSWDWARFESCAQKWIDLSEGDYGVSLLNDCKYGHDVRGHIMRLTCLRSPIDPDPTADQGEHLFTYALFPHTGDWRNGTIRQAYLLNVPPATAMVDGAGAGPLPPSVSLVDVDRPGVVIETVKPAEDGEGLVVRLYEAHNSRGRAALTFAAPVASAEETTMLEEPVGPLEARDRTVWIDVRPYGITTLRVRFA